MYNKGIIIYLSQALIFLEIRFHSLLLSVCTFHLCLNISHSKKTGNYKSDYCLQIITCCIAPYKYLK